MDVKKKLVELLGNMQCIDIGIYWCYDCKYRYEESCNVKAFAEHLIANGVTVADGKNTDGPTGWIPASEPPKEPGEYIVAQKHWSDGHLETKKGKWNGVEWLVDGRESLMVTHWMPPSPLPEPPKGE